MWRLVKGRLPSGHLVHRDGDLLNNHISNLMYRRNEIPTMIRKQHVTLLRAQAFKRRQAMKAKKHSSS